jgi:hypothetical protein
MGFSNLFLFNSSSAVDKSGICYYFYVTAVIN